MDSQTELQRRAAAGEAEAQWEFNLRPRVSEQITPPGITTLRLRPVNCRLRPGLRRDMGQVDKGLVAKFRDLALGKARWPLLLFGNVGTGKTRASLALADFAATAIYTTAEELADQVMGPDSRAMWQQVEEKDLAILDEIGVRQNVTDLAYTSLKRFIDLREEYHNSVAIYITNLHPAKLRDLFDDRIESRLVSGTVFELSGPDRRQQQ